MKRWLIAILMLLPGHVWADIPKNAIQLTIDDGLSQSTVSDLHQDQGGRIWLATGDGISIYNGSSFDYIFRSPNPLTGFQGVYIQTIFEDSFGNIWIGSLGGGIGIFDQQGHYLQGFNVEQGTLDAVDVYDFTQDTSGHIWAASNEGLIVFSKEGAGFSHSKSLPLTTPNGSKLIRSVLALPDGSVLAGTASGGIARYAPPTDTTIWYDPDNSALGSVAIHKLFLARDGLVWVGTEDAGVYVFTPNDETFSQPVSLPDSNIPALSEAPDGRFWFGSDASGVFVFDPESGTVENYRSHQGQIHRISSNSILAIEPDRSGRMWLGTADGGVSSVSLRPDFFETYYPDPLGEIGPSSGVIWSIAEGRENDVWIGTKHGFSRFLRTEQRFTAVDLGEGSSDVRAILPRGNELLLAVKDRGLLHFDPTTGSVKDALGADGKNLFDGIYIRLILEDADGSLWIGTHSGLYHLSADLQLIHRYRADGEVGSLPHNRIRGLYQSPNGQLWVGTSGGLSAFQPETNDFTSYLGRDFLPSDDVRAIYEQDGKLFVGTESGIAILDLASMQPRFLLREHGLPNETIYSLLPDGNGSLWIMTNNGLVQMDIATERLEVYLARDGLQGAEFNFNAFDKFSDGTIAVGGINGLSFFNPTQLAKNDLPPILDLAPSGSNIERKTNDSLGVAPHTLSLKLGVQHYDEPGENLLRWKLEPLDAEWNEAKGVSHRILRENLPAGDYRLRAVGLSPAGVAGEELVLSFRIEQSPWLRWYALVAYTLAATLFIAAISSLRTLQIRRRNAELETQVTEKTRELQASNAALQSAAQERTSFYSRTAHEIRTPLSLIRAPLQSILSDKALSAKDRRHAELIERATQRLVQITDEMAAVSQGSMEIKTGQASLDIAAFLSPIVELYCESAASRGVRFVPPELPSKAATFDHTAAETILHNLLSNAVKNTPTGGRIEFSCTLVAEWLKFTIRNDGHKLSPDALRKLKDYATRDDLPTARRGLELIGASVRAAGGTLSAEAEGVHIHIALPAHSAGDKAPNPASISTTGMQRILVVEDDRDLREYLSELLSPLAEVQTVASLAAARRAVEGQVFHLVLCDVNLPDGSGFDFGKRIKEEVETSHIPLIFLTARTDEPSYEKGLDAWADDYLTKPFEASELLAKIRIRLRSATMLREYLVKQLAQHRPVPQENAPTLPPMDERFVERFQSFLKAQIGNGGATINDAAKHCNMSKRAMQRKLDALYGQSFSGLLTTARMTRAAELLKAGLSVSEVASACGYMNPSSFSRQFRETHGLSPRDFMKEISH